MTHYQNLEIARMAKGKGHQGTWTLERVFDKFPRLADRRYHRGANLSGGEQQMLSIARALMNEPDLLLDEPSEGLAPLIVRELQSITKEIVQEGITVLLVEQNLEMCLSLADRHYLMDQGCIVYHGTNEEFKANDEVKDRYLALSAVAEESAEES